MYPVKKRNMIVQIILMICTFGLYGVYWFYQTAQEIKHHLKDEEASPTLWTLLLFVPFFGLYAHYKYSEMFVQISSEKMNKWLMFVLWLVFSPAVWFIVQRDLNMIADQLEQVGNEMKTT